MSKINSLLVPNRLKILKILQKDSTCVCEIVEKLKLKHNLVSHHLKTLQDMNYVESHREGQHIIYSLKNDKRPVVESLMNLIVIFNKHENS